MSYLSQSTSKIDYGVVKVGDFIEVSDDGIISLLQDVSPNANVMFNSIDVDQLTVNGDNVVTSVTPSAGDGISIDNLVSTGYNVTFDVVNTGVLSAIAGDGISVSSATGDVTIDNTGVLSLIAGSGISISGSTGNITISSFGADLINVYGTTTSYTATLNDEYIGVSSATAVTITLPAGVNGRVYIIKDEYGQGSGKITIQPPVGVLIDKKTSYIISVPNQSVQIVYRAGGWWII